MKNEVELAARLKDSPLFWSKVNKTETCWLWTGHLNHKGYGRYGRIGAHRLTYIMFNGPIPEGYEPDHLCRVHNCVNPAHSEAVTKRVNILRGVSFSAVNAAKTRCPKGHPYGVNRQVCRTCKKERNALLTKHRQEQRAKAFLTGQCSYCLAGRTDLVRAELRQGPRGHYDFSQHHRLCGECRKCIGPIWRYCQCA